MMSSMPDRLSHEFSCLVSDLRRGLTQKTLHPICTCGCKRRCHALRMLWVIPKHIFTYRLNPIHWADTVLIRDHHRTLDGLKGQVSYESFLWDRQFENAGICTVCGKGRYTYSRHLALCQNCGAATLLRGGC